MTAADVRKRFDEIVEFAGVHQYLDTPVKRYSSGMSMRLAFSVAAHLEPEVLIVDEVLAVGDSGFHKQCLDKMTEAVRDGRTVLFISHNLAAVTHLCGQGLLLQQGCVIGQGTASEVVAQYLAIGRVAEGTALIEAGSSDGRVRFQSVSVAPTGKETSAQIDRDEGVEVLIEYDVSEAVAGCQIGLELWNYEGICVLSSGILDRDPTRRPVQLPGNHTLACRIPPDYFRAGMYSISLTASTAEDGVIAQASDGISFEIVDLSSPESKMLESENGAVRPVLEWMEIGESSRMGAVTA